MTLFAIIQQPGTNGERLSGAIETAYPEAKYDLANGVWIVSDIATAKEISDKVGISGGANGSAIVLEVASYFGRANPAIWSWMKAKWERPPNG
jgi:hypothetical protein